MDLSSYRKKIDEIDEQLITLFCRRMELVKEIAFEKAHAKAPVKNNSRENEILNKAAEQAGSELAGYAADWFRSLLDVSCSYQEMLLSEKKQPLLSKAAAFQTASKVYQAPVLYGLVGRKLGHSYSKLIHEKLHAYPYALIPLEPDELDHFLKERRFRGLNVTIPYKTTVMAYCDVVSPLAQSIGAVNTLYFDSEKRLCGTNTDYAGFLYALESARISVYEKNILILGDGATCKTICKAVSDSGARQIFIAARKASACVRNNRHNCRADQSVSCLCSKVSYDDLSSCKEVDIIINTTPVGMYPNTEAQLIDLRNFPRCCGVFDVIYNPARTKLLAQAEDLGIPHANGLSMLIAQAVESAVYFTGDEGLRQKKQSIFHELHPLLMDQPEKTEAARSCPPQAKPSGHTIYLIGFMGVGKSSVAALLAQRLCCACTELDSLIEKRAGLPIPLLFSAYGETYFRFLETETLLSLENTSSPLHIVACGGGAPLRPQNVQRMKQNGKIILLTASAETIWQRIGGQPGRPLLDKTNDLASIRRLMDQRRAAYESAADLTLSTDSLSTAEVCGILIDKLSSAFGISAP